jgi:cytidine deaminase
LKIPLIVVIFNKISRAQVVRNISKFNFNDMKKQHMEIEYTETDDISSLDADDVHLVNMAKATAMKAYAPYSGFCVGAALLLENGEIITGSNQENAAYPLGLCAERTALYYAGSQFPDMPVKTIAITAWHNGSFVAEPIPPCGGCRQVFLETQERYGNKIKVIMYGEKLIRIVRDVQKLLPFPFKKIN